jgi:hypothetical protein
LREIIERHQTVSGRETTIMIWLTVAIAILTFVMLLGLGAQIYLAFNPPN